MKQKRPFVLAAKDKITKLYVYVANSKAQNGDIPETTSSQEDALKFESQDDANAMLATLAANGKGFAVKKI